LRFSLYIVHARALQNADKTPMKITVASGSLQPFTTDQWAMHQQDTIRKVTNEAGEEERVRRCD
jgi:hypothetical protein